MIKLPKFALQDLFQRNAPFHGMILGYALVAMATAYGDEWCVEYFTPGPQVRIILN